MTPERYKFEDLEPDIVNLVLQRVIAMAPGFTHALALQIEHEIKEEHGGKRVFVPKGAKRMSLEQREAVFKDGLSNMSAGELIKKHKISRSTMYRTMKQGGRFGG